MKIILGTKPIESEGLRKVGFAFVNLATAVDRHDLQLSQARNKPDDETERQQADKSASRVIGAQRKLRKLLDAALT